MKPYQRAIAALACVASATLAQAALPPGLSGSWYNPAQPGHGLTVEVLDQERVLAGWYVFDPAGKPVNLYLEGEIQGATVRSKAYVARGMRFGSFNPSEHRVQHWGTVTVVFTSCDSATLTWNANGAAGQGYGSGSMPLSRLTGISHVDCEFSGVLSRLPSGTYSGTWDRPGGSRSGPYPLHAAVDSVGHLWAAPAPIPGQESSTAQPPPVFFGYRGYEFGGAHVMELSASYDFSSSNNPIRGNFGLSDLKFTLGSRGTISAAGTSDGEPTLVQRYEFAHDPAVVDSLLLEAFDPASLSGSTFRFGPRAYPIRFESASRFCIDMQRSCELVGDIGAVDKGLAMFDVKILDDRGEIYAYRGKAWLSGTPRKLFIATRNGVDAFSAVATQD
jgi:hypothetical protein